MNVDIQPVIEHIRDLMDAIEAAYPELLSLIEAG